MSDGNTVFYANEAFFNLLLNRYYTANSQAFSGSRAIPELEVEFEFTLDGAPTVDLSPRTDGANLAIKFDQVKLNSYDYQNGVRGGLTKSVLVQLTVTGTMALNGQSLTINNLKASGGNFLDKKVAKMVNETMIPQYQKQVSNISMPDFTKLVGFPVTLQTLDMANNLVQVSAMVGGAAGAPDFPVQVLQNPSIIAAISGAAINELAATQFQPVQAEASSKKSKWGEGYEGSAQAGAKNPQLHISGGEGAGTIHVWASAKGGIEMAGHWIHEGISVTTRTPPLGLRLETDDARKKATVKVFLNGSVSLDFDLPGALEKMGHKILGAIDSLPDKITDQINGALDRISIPAFKLPSQIPGTAASADMEFDQLGFYGNSAIAVIRVS